MHFFNNTAQSSEIMGRISNQSHRFSASKTSEDETKNNDCTSIINFTTASLGNVDSLVNS